MPPLSIFDPPEPAANPETSAGPQWPGSGPCGKCVSTPRHWKLTVGPLDGSGPLPPEYGGTHILERRIPDPPNIDGKCVWLSPPVDLVALLGAGTYIDDVHTGSLWRLSWDAEESPYEGDPVELFAQRWTLAAGGHYWGLYAAPPSTLIPGASLFTNPFWGFAVYNLAPIPGRLDKYFRCLFPNTFELGLQTGTAQFPATVIISPWWP